MLLGHLSVFWTLSPQYQYGWLVPPLAAYLFYKRWRTAPGAAPAGHRGAMALTATCALLLPPVWVVRTATPDWSTIGFCLAALVTGLTLGLLARAGGWRMARHLAFPVLFIFCAVPWPQRLENAVIQSLMRFVAAGTVEIMQWCGIAAEQHGNLVSLGRATIGISEACSGVRSIQSMAMASLFLGELRRFRTGARVILLLCGAGLAVLFNLVRNTLLALVANHSGAAAIERWHDSAGWGILLASFFLLLLVARALGRPAPVAEHTAPPDLQFPAWLGAVLAIWFAFIAAGNEWWYRAHERKDVERIEIRWPLASEGFQTVPIPDRARDITLCSEAQSAAWTGENGLRWMLTSLRWAPGRTASQSARIHQPDVCLEASGAVPVMELPPVTLQADGGEMVFHAWLFQYAGRPVYVFYNLWEEANRDQLNDTLQQDWSPWSRVQRALTGQRNLGQQSVEIAIQGCDSQEEALRTVRGSLPSLVRIQQN